MQTDARGEGERKKSVAFTQVGAWTKTVTSMLASQRGQASLPLSRTICGWMQVARCLQNQIPNRSASCKCSQVQSVIRLCRCSVTGTSRLSLRVETAIRRLRSPVRRTKDQCSTTCIAIAMWLSSFAVRNTVHDVILLFVAKKTITSLKSLL